MHLTSFSSASEVLCDFKVIAGLLLFQDFFHYVIRLISTIYNMYLIRNIVLEVEKTIFIEKWGISNKSNRNPP